MVSFVYIDSLFRVSLNYSDSIFNTSCFLDFTANMVDTGGGFLEGSSYDNNPVWAVPLNDPVYLDRYYSVVPTMLDLVKELNGVGFDDDGLLGATCLNTRNCLSMQNVLIAWSLALDITPNPQLDYTTIS